MSVARKGKTGEHFEGDSAHSRLEPSLTMTVDELEKLAQAVSAAISSTSSSPARSKPELPRFQPLPGDASDRRYYRVRTASLSHIGSSDLVGQSIVVMKLAEPCRGTDLPFLQIHRHLERIGTPVPRVIGCDLGAGIVLLEDLGDVTLQMFLRDADRQTARKMYIRAVDILLNMHTAGSRATRPEPPAFRIFFDVEKFVWELEFFLEHMIRGLLGQPVSERDAAEFGRQFTALSTVLTREPRVFTHRDYHSRNIMVHQGELRILDFQDARMGLCQYDLASLLRDSYVTLDEDLVEELIEYYVTAKERRESTAIDRGTFRRLFDLTAVQRNLKAIGTFSYQMMGKGNPAYLAYIKPTLRYVRANVARYPELHALGSLLCKYLIPPYSFD